LIRHDLTTGERVEITRPEKGGYIIPSLSPDGRLVLYNRKDRHPGGVQLWLCGADGSGDREIVNAGDDKKAFAVWMPDSRRLVVVAETATHMRVGIYDTVSGETRWLIDDPARTIAGVMSMISDAKLV